MWDPEVTSRRCLSATSDWPALVEEQTEAMLADLCQLIGYPSYFQFDHSGTPFGQPIDDCLDATLAICRRFGFITHKDPEGYYGYADVGHGEGLIGLFCHLDVVGAGEPSGWFSDPFTGVLRNGRLYGRGSQDNKGPTLACLYALHLLQRHGPGLRHKVRVVFGTDQELLGRCIQRYKQWERLPDVSFCPDSAFPLVNAEKRLIQAYLYGPPSDDLVLDCGDIFNAVPDRALYSGPQQRKLQRQLDLLGYPWRQQDKGTLVLGQGAHASVCNQSGVNAIVRLCRALQGIGYRHPALGLCSLVIGEDTSMRALLGSVRDDLSGELTVNLAKLKLDRHGCQVGIDVRVPVSFSRQEYHRLMREAVARLGWRYEEFDHLEPMFVPAHAPFVQALSRAYETVTGERARPRASGAATYARAIPNCVAFGALLPGHPRVEHMPNEFISVEGLVKACTIYAEALAQLQQLPLAEMAVGS